MMNDKRERLYMATLLGCLRPLAAHAGVKDFEQTTAGKAAQCDAELKDFADKGCAYATGTSMMATATGQSGRLTSVFSDIALPNGGDAKTASPHFFPLKALSVEDDRCFAGPTPEDGGSYAELWQKVESECGQASAASERSLSMLKKHTWCVPSVFDRPTSTSLYDVAKTAAAFAVCLYDHAQANGGGDKPFLLLGCDVSGIQSFIYNIASRKAAVSLKGRSFYIQLLIDSVIYRICNDERIRAFASQVVYSSGGKAYLLLPNTEGIKEAIGALKRELERELLDTHHGQLMVNIAWVEFGINATTNAANLHFADYDNAEIGLLWRELAERLTECKSQRFRSALNIGMFRPQKVAADVRVCAVTGIESANCVVLDQNSKDDEKTYVLPIVKQQTELGQQLKDADYIAAWQGQANEKPDVTVFGVNYELLSSKDLPRLASIGKDIALYAINDMEAKTAVRFYGGNAQALNHKLENKTFEELADEQYFGVLRMDVDNLGAIFVNGLPESAKNFSAYSNLSFLLDYFFSGYINSIRNSSEFSDHVNILYSGGDDVFAVGRWDKLILFAERIRKDFGRFTGRSDMSISGGITFVGDKFPIAKAAELAGVAEDKAKAANGGDKNALNMFGMSVSWDGEYDFVKAKQQKFVDLISNYNMPHSILHRLMILCEQMHRGRSAARPAAKDYSYIWHGTYFLKRFCEGKRQEVIDFCHDMQKQLCDKRKFELIAIAARWAEYELRFNKNNK